MKNLKFHLKTLHVYVAFMVSVLALLVIWGAEKYLPRASMFCVTTIAIVLAITTIHSLFQDLTHTLHVLEKRTRETEKLRAENAALRAQNENRHSISPEVKGAMSILGITVCPFSRGEVIQAHRALIARTHPDHHGANPDATRVNGARDTLLRFLNLREHGKVANV